MMPFVENALTALPVLVLHFAVANLVFVAGVGLYILVTPYHDLRLIREGNAAAGTALAGALIALALPVATALRYALSVQDIVVWGAIAVALQLAVFAVVSVLLRGIGRAIEAGEVASALKLAASQVSVGLINAAAIGG